MNMSIKICVRRGITSPILYLILFAKNQKVLFAKNQKVFYVQYIFSIPYEGMLCSEHIPYIGENREHEHIDVTP